MNESSRRKRAAGVPPGPIRAAGGLLWKEAGGVRRLAVIHRARHGDWTLPKGKLEAGEDWRDAAVREVREETGCDPRVERFAGTVRYKVNGVPKEVRFWNMTSAGPGAFHPGEEVARLEWLTPDEAVRRLDHPGERDLVRRAIGKAQPA